ncbi:MAG: hypothetical protein K2O45_18550 [Oscillospiraceae bacterium]|nr:hypothetical protein [Oscillospiraceae bacterium]
MEKPHVRFFGCIDYRMRLSGGFPGKSHSPEAEIAPEQPEEQPLHIRHLLSLYKPINLVG